MEFRKRGFSGTLNPAISQREREHRTLARKTAAEGMVLLENNGILPLAPGTPVALYGGGARYTVKGGTGSGSVNNRSNVSIDEGLRSAGLWITTDEWLDHFDSTYAEVREKWMAEIYANTEVGDFFSLYTAYSTRRLQMPAGDPFTKTEAETAIYVISRISGESVDRRNEKGDYLLSDVEEVALERLVKLYPKVIVILNVGGVMDLSFLDRLPIAAVVLMSQAGMEGGNALGDVLTGKVNPSGKLTDTWANRFADYPSSETFSYLNGNLDKEKYSDGIYVGYRYFDSFSVRPRYPFGYGLSYTRFSIEPLSVELAGKRIGVTVRVTNAGSLPGKEVVQLYAACPQTLRIKERKRMVAFAKTRTLAPGEAEERTIYFDPRLLESYHTGRSVSYLEAGSYTLFVGNSAEHILPAARLTVSTYTVMQQLHPICPLVDALTEIEPSRDQAQEWADFCSALEVPELRIDSLLDAVRADIAGKTDVLPMPKTKEAAQILAQMTRLQKAQMVCGQPSFGSKEIVGTAALHVPGAAGETTGSAEDLGIGEMILADGPAGIRVLQCYEENPTDGSIYRMTGYEGLENRFFGKEFHHEGAIPHYQFCSAIPVGTLLAQSFDTELLEEVGSLVGREMKELGITLWLAPGMNIHRNPLCGRNFEYYSEDPILSGAMAAAITRGVQKLPGIGTTIKHYACNNQEDNRMDVSSIVSERALREIYLKGFELAVKQAQPMSLMTSYNRINGIHTANSYDLCTTVARKEWGFRGMIMTDWTTTNAGHGSSAVKCIQCGNDLIMPGNQSDILEILDALEAKKDLYLAEEDLDVCVMRMLRTILQSDVYPDALPYDSSSPDFHKFLFSL